MTEQVVLIKHRIGTATYVGPFADMEEAATWASDNGGGWVAVPMQSPFLPVDWSR